MKKILSVFLLVTTLISLFAGCSKKDTFEENNDIFFRMVLNRLEQDEVEIQSVDAYNVENRYYYHITYSYISPVTNEWTDADLVYFGTNQIDRYFSLKWDDFGDMAEDRDAYYSAVKNGEHKSFSQEEIQQYVNVFYSTKQENNKEEK